MQKVNLAQKLASFDETWVPKVIGELNGQCVKVVKFQGEYVWHQHENEDEMFLVLKGRMTVHMQDGDIILDEGEFLIVPRGVQHKPSAAELTEILLFEPASTRNTGEVDEARTIEPNDLERV